MSLKNDNWKYAFFALLLVNSIALVYYFTDLSGLDFDQAEVQKTKETITEKQAKKSKDIEATKKKIEELMAKKKEGLPKPTIPVLIDRSEKISESCTQSLAKVSKSFSKKTIAKICRDVQVFDQCYSAKGDPIYHYDKLSKRKGNHQNILVLSLVHGDEVPSGAVAMSWMERLQDINPRNNWRVIPLLNPDGFAKRTRTNGRGVDINRNFPTRDWDELAHKYWKKFAKGSKRRNPGKVAGSEPETRCTIRHIQEFQPDFIISIHTPLGLLDFDGPQRIPFPNFKPLPWRSLGHFPGSLGRYMWRDHGVPVLTVELSGGRELVRKSLDQFDQLQDITGTVAIQSQKVIDQLGIEQKTPEFKTKLSDNGDKKEKKVN